jgi:fructose-1,6-bisphosphatase/inositol monophosphatase family enzyme
MSIPTFNSDKISQQLHDVAHRIILPRYKQLEANEISSKSSANDLVTIADREAEIEMQKYFNLESPGSGFVGEESVSEGRVSTDVLRERDKLIWVVDPVDGTYNFVHGKPEFGMLLACVYNGEVIHGWLYDILGNKMIEASKGGGASLNGNRLKTAAPKSDIYDLVGHAGVKYFPPILHDNILEFRERVEYLQTLSAACFEYFRILEAKSDFAIYSSIRPWDHLAGVLAIQEAGGVGVKWDGSAYRPSDNFGGLLIASNQQVWDTVSAECINGMMQKYEEK